MTRFTTAAALFLGLGGHTLVPAAFAQSAAESAAALTEITFFVENMTCALCPVTVKAAMSAVEGVREVEVDFPAQTAHVVFDPALTDPAAIAHASAQAGYPAAAQD